jgi:hypothetical protein
MDIIESELDLAKHRYFSHICRCLPNQLLKKVFLLRLQDLHVSNEINFSIRQFQARKRNPPWLYEVITQILPKYNLQQYADPQITNLLSKKEWSKIIQPKVLEYDFKKLNSSMLNRGTDAGRFYHQIRGSIIQKCDPYI